MEKVPISGSMVYVAREPNYSDEPAFSFGELPADEFKAEYLRLTKADLAEAQAHLDDLPESQRRGLSIETLRFFHCGYLPKYVLTKSRAEFRCGLYVDKETGAPKHLPPASERIIIPTASMEHFGAVATPRARRSMSSVFWKQHAGEKEIFCDPAALNADVIVVVEGEIDCMTIWQASGAKIAVVAMLGCSNFAKTLGVKLSRLKDKKFILLLDADAAGKKNAVKLRDKLISEGYPTTCAYLFDFMPPEFKKHPENIKVDANQILVEYGADQLNSCLKRAVEYSLPLLDVAAEQIEKNKMPQGADPDIPLPKPRKTQSTPAGKSNLTFDDNLGESRQVVADCLKVIPASQLARDDWFSVGSIIKYYGFDFEVFDQWSNDGDSRYTRDACKTQWQSMKTADELGNSAAVKIGTLIKLAKEFGYQPPRRFKPKKVPEQFRLPDEDREFLFSGDASDLDNARRLERLDGEIIRFVTNRKQWMTFKNGLWRLDDEGDSAISPNFTRLADILAANAAPDDKHETTLARRLKSSKVVGSAIKAFRSLVSVRISADDLNRHNNLLNCLNGVVDLQTGKFYPDVDPKLLITQRAGACYLPNYRNPHVEKFLRDILPDDETRNVLIRYLAYGLTGESREEKVLFAHGTGGNGKGTLTKTVMKSYGDYAAVIQPKIFIYNQFGRDAGDATPELNVLVNCRMAIAEEFPQGARLDAAVFKNLSGSDMIAVRRLHHEQEMFDPKFSLMLSGNYLPELSDTRDPGLLRRIMLVYFTQSFTGNRADPLLKAKLSTPEALNGFLSLMIEESFIWYREGLLLPSSAMKQSATEYFEENDFIGEFINEHCVRGQGYSIPRKEFLDRLKSEYPADCMKQFGNRDRSLVDAIKRIDGVEYKTGHGRERRFYGLSWRKSNAQTYAEDYQSAPYDPDYAPPEEFDLSQFDD